METWNKRICFFKNRSSYQYASLFFLKLELMLSLITPRFMTMKIIYISIYKSYITISFFIAQQPSHLSLKGKFCFWDNRGSEFYSIRDCASFINLALLIVSIQEKSFYNFFGTWWSTLSRTILNLFFWTNVAYLS